MVEPPVSYLEPHGPPPLPARQGVSILLAALVWASSYAISSTTVDPPTPSPPDRHRHSKKKKAISDELKACAEANGYQKGPHREEDSRRDGNKHVDKTKKDQDATLGHYVM